MFNKGQKAKWNSTNGWELWFLWNRDEEKYIFSLNGQLYSSLEKLECIKPQHQLESFECTRNCSMGPIVCKNCSYLSKDPKNGPDCWMCKLCKLTEDMENFD